MNNSNKPLLQILVEELPKIGGWPDDMNYCGQSAYDNELYFYRHPYTGQPCDKRGIFTDSHRSEYAYTPISRDHYEAALAASKEPLKFSGDDGWMLWQGGECPVDSDAIVEVKYRKPNPYQLNNERAGDFAWAHDGIDDDIIAYRLQQPHEVKTAGIDVQRDAVKSNDAQLESDLNDCIGQPQEDIKNIRAEMLEVLNDTGLVMKLHTAMKLVDAFIDAGYRKQ